jgi:glycerol-3-phosphate acyltransferase PlsY
VAAAAGAAAVVGHNWSVFIGFSGGRGVATSAGGLLVLSPLTLLILAPILVIVVWLTRYVSLGSLAVAVGGPLITAMLSVMGVVGWAAAAFTLVAGLLIVIAHRDNVARLRAGTERRLGERAMVASDDGT